MSAPVAIHCRGLRKAFGDAVAVDRLELAVARGGLTAVLGPSGCGKTTLLRLLAGFERPDAGTIEIGGELVAGPGRFVPPERRRVGMVFQDYALFPHLDVAENVGYALGRHPDRRRVDELLELVGLRGLARRRPHELSGGQQQRVALARALAPGPELVLLDEPFSNLDAALRVQVRRELRRILAQTGVTALLVTHDQEEALSLADQVAVMRAGAVAQTGTPEDVYLRPRSRWVAEFLGAVNVLPGRSADGRIVTPIGVVDGNGHGGDVELLVRPEAIALAPEGERTPDDAVPVTVVAREFYGHDQLVVVALPDGDRLRHRASGLARWQPGDRARAWLAGPAVVLPPS